MDITSRRCAAAAQSECVVLVHHAIDYGILYVWCANALLRRCAFVCMCEKCVSYREMLGGWLYAFIYNLIMSQTYGYYSCYIVTCSSSRSLTKMLFASCFFLPSA